MNTGDVPEGGIAVRGGGRPAGPSRKLSLHVARREANGTKGPRARPPGCLAAGTLAQRPACAERRVPGPGARGDLHYGSRRAVNPSRAEKAQVRRVACLCRQPAGSRMQVTGVHVATGYAPARR